MFTIAFLIGTYSYIIFFLGLFGLLFKPLIIPITLLFLSTIAYARKKFRFDFSIFKSKISVAIYLLLIVQILVNLVGALGPELGFDALWYHVPIPQMYVTYHRLFHIPSPLFYYADMPKLVEMLYVGALSFGVNVFTKLISFGFGILCCIALYKLARKFISPFFSLITVAIFYSNLVVGWESITAYIDLGRTFFEIVSLYLFYNFFETKKEKYLMQSAITTGLTITTKILALGTLGILSVLIFVVALVRKLPKMIIGKLLLLYLLLSLLVPLPWFLFSFVHTGNPFYPFFSPVYPTTFSLSLINPIRFFKDMWAIFMQSQDPISPIYIAFLPLYVVTFKKYLLKERLLVLYSILALLVWYITPRTGGGRFMLPYLPAFSLLVGITLHHMEKQMKTFLIAVVCMVLIISIAYRGMANAKYLPVLIGKESQARFLENNLNFSFGDFADIDGFFTRTIKPTDTVLLLGFHNLYYVDFPFTLWEDHRQFNYIATQHTTLPKQFSSWKKVYSNNKTGVALYKKPS